MEELYLHRKDKLFFYSPFNFIREISPAVQQEAIILPELKKKLDQAVEINVNGSNHLFFVELLPWDTAYFNIPTYKLNHVLYSHDDVSVLTEATNRFLQTITAAGAYLFIEIPSEDIVLIQALGNAGFKLVETRLTYYRGSLQDFNEPRYPVRQATQDDSTNLMRVAREMRNDYDRFHADPVFSTEKADEFLATYIEQSLKGFADVVLTSNEDKLPSDCFLTARYFKNEWEKLGVPVSKMVLSAVSSSTNKGWYKKLITEMTYHLRDAGASYIFMNTQSTNRAVFYTWEQLGYRLGCTTHLLSKTLS